MSKKINIISYLKTTSKKYPNKKAFIINNQNISFSKLYEKVKELSNGMRINGVKKKDKIAVVSNNSLEYIFIFYALADIGAVMIPLNTSLGTKDLIQQIKFTDTKFIFCWHSLINKINIDRKKIKIKKEKIISLGRKIVGFKNFENLLIKKDVSFKNIVSVDSDFIIGMTSGSTSKPKAIVYSQKTKLLRGLNAKQIYDLSHKDVLILSTPMKQSISHRFLFLPAIIGSTCVIMQNFNGKNWLHLVQKYKVSFSILVSDQIRNVLSRMRKKDKRVKSLKSLVSCCSELQDQTKIELLNKFKCNVFDTYGASELGTVTNINLKKDFKKYKTLGKATNVVDIKIFDKKQKEVKRKNCPGEIYCKSKLICSRYYKSKNLTNLTKMNYFKTGDIGYLDNDKYLHLTGRSKDMIIIGGNNLYPKDIEVVLNKYKTIKESAVIGIPDKRLGETILACIVLKKDKKLNMFDLKKYCIKNLADHQLPQSFKILKELPKQGGYNKISKYKLKQQFGSLDLSKNIRTTLSRF